MKAASETGLVKVLLQRLALVPGCYAWRQNTAGILRRNRRGKDYMAPAPLRGVSDIIGWIEQRELARFLACEAKMPGRIATAEQANFLMRVRAAGGLAVLAYSVADLERYLLMEGVEL